MRNYWEFSAATFSTSEFWVMSNNFVYNEDLVSVRAILLQVWCNDFVNPCILDPVLLVLVDIANMSNRISDKKYHRLNSSEVSASIRSMKASQLQQLRRKGLESNMNESVLARMWSASVWHASAVIMGSERACVCAGTVTLALNRSRVSVS